MTTFSEADWGRYAERVDDLEEQGDDHEARLRTLEKQVVTMIAKAGVVIAIVMLLVTLAGSYFGAHIH